MPKTFRVAFLLCVCTAFFTSHVSAIPTAVSLASPSNSTAVGDAATSKISTSKITFYNFLGVPYAWDEVYVTIDGKDYHHDDHPDTVTIGSTIQYNAWLCRYVGGTCDQSIWLQVQCKVNEPSPGDDTFLSFIWLSWQRIVKAEMSYHIELIGACLRASSIASSGYQDFEYWQSKPGLVWDSKPTQSFDVVDRLCKSGNAPCNPFARKCWNDGCWTPECK